MLNIFSAIYLSTYLQTVFHNHKTAENINFLNSSVPTFRLFHSTKSSKNLLRLPRWFQDPSLPPRKRLGAGEAALRRPKHYRHPRPVLHQIRQTIHRLPLQIPRGTGDQGRQAGDELLRDGRQRPGGRFGGGYLEGERETDGQTGRDPHFVRGFGLAELGPAQIWVCGSYREEHQHQGDVADEAADADGGGGGVHGGGQVRRAHAEELREELHGVLQLQERCLLYDWRVQQEEVRGYLRQRCGPNSRGVEPKLSHC